MRLIGSFSSSGEALKVPTLRRVGDANRAGERRLHACRARWCLGDTCECFRLKLAGRDPLFLWFREVGLDFPVDGIVLYG